MRLAGCLSVLILVTFATSSGAPLMLTGEAKLVTCRPITTRPCMQLVLTLPPGAVAVADPGATSVRMEDSTLKPFYLHQGGGILQLTFPMPYKDLSSLLGYSVDTHFFGKLEDGREIASVIPWGSGAFAAAYEGQCDPEERARAPRQTDPIAMVRPLLVTLGFGALLCVAWFFVPNWIWGEDPPVLQPVRKRRLGA